MKAGTETSAARVSWAEVSDSHDRYLRQMNCQVVHASLHTRAGWTREYVLRVGGRAVGHGSAVVGGPWTESATVFEFFVEKASVAEAFRLFEALLVESGATRILAQTNDVLLTALLHARAHEVRCEKLLFADGRTTELPAGDAVFRRVRADDAERMFMHEIEPEGEYVLEYAGEVAATGGVMCHYNPPYGDVFMEVAPKFRRRGLGAYLVQELKRVCRGEGNVPCARCDPSNVASRQTCLRAGFVPVGVVASGRVRF